VKDRDKTPRITGVILIILVLQVIFRPSLLIVVYLFIMID
jgi:hypothetical protein